jgi:hypothetical protein
MNVIIYSSLGQILRQLTVSSELADAQKAEDEFILFGSADDITQYINTETGEIVDKPVKPDEYSEFNWQTKQWEGNAQIAKDNVLRERQRLLTATDWTDTYSASTRLENYNAWQFYRQQLRDITTQEGYPFNVIWPTQPV